MSDVSTVKRVSFWKEAWPEIKAALKAEWGWVWGIAVVIAIIHLIFLFLFGLPTPSNPSPPMHRLFGLVLIIPDIIPIYLFNVVCLRRAAKIGPPQMTIGNFFYWLWSVMRKFLVMMLVGLGCGVCAGIGSGISSAMKKTGAAGALIPSVIGFILCAICFVYFMHMACRLFLVTPLAVLKNKLVLKKSWGLTKGYCWRIFGGGLILAIFLILIFLIPLAVCLGVVILLGKTPLVIGILSAVMQGAWAGIGGMAGAVYVCTVYRVLLREQKNNSLLPQT